MFLFNYLLFLVGLLLSLAFYTLLERKTMGYIHYRKGPNKVSILGMLQPMADAMKLLTKESIKLSYWKLFIYLISPFISLSVLFLSGGWMESDFMTMDEPKLLGLLCVMSLGSFGFLFMGWGSNSSFPILGVMRTIVLMISYEVCMLLVIFLLYFSLLDSMNNYIISKMQENLWNLYLSPYIFMTWVMITASELSRTPFDLSESESELVSGVNTEYFGGLFSLLFMAEYGMMILLSLTTSFLFLGGTKWIIFTTFFMCFILVWMRCTLPRVRYDTYMLVCWKLFMPFLLLLLIFLLLL